MRAVSILWLVVCSACATHLDPAPDAAIPAMCGDTNSGAYCGGDHVPGDSSTLY